jgi:hypothetical protein
LDSHSRALPWFESRLDGLIKDAKDIVDDHLAMSAKNDAPKGETSWWRRFLYR